MTTLENAARQALEALEEYQNEGAPFMSCDAAVEALSQALEQPVQEPVRWLYDWKNDGLTVTDWVTSDKDEAYAEGHTNIRPLYTAPQPARKWVGLTDEEIAQVIGDPLDEIYLSDFRKVISALKERNT